MSPSEMGACEDDFTGAADGEAVVSVMACATSGDDEREVASIILERDPRRQQQTVRVSNAASNAGRRVRLRVVADKSPPLEWRALTSEGKKDDDAGGTGTSTAALVRFRAGTLVLQSRVSFPKARTYHVGDAPFEKTLGSLRKLGVVAQLRFAPETSREENGRTSIENGPPKNADKNAPSLSSPQTATAFRLLDAAITFDDDRAVGRAASASAGHIALPLARDVLLAEQKTPAPRAGRSPDIWDPEPAQNAQDVAVLATRARRRAEMLRDTPRWAGTETACAPLLARREARVCDMLGADVRLDCVLELASRLRLAQLECADPAAPAPAVTTTLVDSVRASVRGGVSFRSSPSGSTSGVDSRTRGTLEARRAAELRSLEDALDSLDDLIGLDVDGLSGAARAARARRDAARTMVKDLELLIRERGLWDAHESGVETRDVLENGLRRADMERALGRPASKQDIDASMAIPAAERARVVAGLDVEKARLTGRPEYVDRLPFQ